MAPFLDALGLDFTDITKTISFSIILSIFTALLYFFGKTYYWGRAGYFFGELPKKKILPDHSSVIIAGVILLICYIIVPALLSFGVLQVFNSLPSISSGGLSLSLSLLPGLIVPLLALYISICFSSLFPSSKRARTQSMLHILLITVEMVVAYWLFSLPNPHPLLQFSIWASPILIFISVIMIIAMQGNVESQRSIRIPQNQSGQNRRGQVHVSHSARRH